MAKTKRLFPGHPQYIEGRRRYVRSWQKIRLILPYADHNCRAWRCNLNWLNILLLLQGGRCETSITVFSQWWARWSASRASSLIALMCLHILFVMARFGLTNYAEGRCKKRFAIFTLQSIFPKNVLTVAICIDRRSLPMPSPRIRKTASRCDL